MSVSNSFTVNSQATTAIENWFEDSIETNAFLDEVFKHEFPEWWQQLSSAHKAARWVRHDVGPWNAKAIVFKKHSTDHIDTGDIGPTAIYTLPSLDQGAYLDLADLQTRLYYAPRSIVIGFFGLLWHFVTESTPRLMDPPQAFKDAHLTPGRVSVVSFFPQTSFAQLKNKPEGWGRATMWGRAGKGDENQEGEEDVEATRSRKKQKIKP